MYYSPLDAITNNVTTPTINDALDHMVRYATKFLAPRLGIDIDTLEYPLMVMSNEAWFLGSPKTLAFHPNDMFDVKDETLWHEVTHFLHAEINPSIFDLYGLDDEATNLVELVASYGSLIFSAMNHPEIFTARQSIINEFDKLDEGLMQGLYFKIKSNESSILNFEEHEGGSQAANYLFEKFGDKFFKDMAFADVDIAKNILNKLGYLDGLFCPYISSDEDSGIKYVYRKEGIEITKVIKDLQVKLLLKHVFEYNNKKYKITL